MPGTSYCYLPDRFVYIESNDDDATVRRVLSDPRTREACIELLSSKVVATITIGGAHESFARSAAHAGGSSSVQLEIPKARFDDVPALRQAPAALVRLTSSVIETARAGDPYRGSLRAPGAVLPQRTVRGVVLALVGLAFWGGLITVSSSNPPTLGWSSYGVGALAGVLLWFAFIALAIALLRQRSTSLRNVCVFALLAVGAIPLGGAAGQSCNRTFDTQPPHVVTGIAVVRSLDGDGSSTNVGSGIARASKPGTFTSTPTPVLETVGSGALGSPYVLSVAPAR